MTREIIKWYQIHKRNLPWRKTKDPYKIWVSEIILQQTQIKTGINYYLKFLKHFPTIKVLANSSENHVLTIWEGLGYYNRALNMLYTAKTVQNELDGVFPSIYDKLINLKGIGEYTAAAISSICADEERAVLDGNVYRVLSRVHNIKEVVGTISAKKLFQKTANKFLYKENPGIYNQAIMDFGAIQCTKHKPKCESCPLQNQCFAYKNDLIHERPIRKKSKKKKIRYFNYLFFNSKTKFIIQQRSRLDIWSKLFEFPLIESKSELIEKEIRKHQICTFLKVHTINQLKVIHQLSHQQLNITFWNIVVKKIPNEFQSISYKEILNTAFPRPIKKYLESKYKNS